MLSYKASKLMAQWYLFLLMFLVFEVLMFLLERIIIKDVLHKVTNLYQLVQRDPSDTNIKKSAADIDISFADNIKVEGSNFNPLSANPTKWPNTLKQFVGNLPMNCLSKFGHFVYLAFKGLTQMIPKFFLLKKRLEISLLHYCHALKSSH